MKQIDSHKITGCLDIRAVRDSIYAPVDESLSIHINGDSDGLRSLAKLLLALAEIDQNDLNHEELPAGASVHTSLVPNITISKTSNETIIGRLDKKDSNGLPDWYTHQDQ